MSVKFRSVWALLAALLLTTICNAQKMDKKTLKQLLGNQGFTGALEGKISFSNLGTIQCNGTVLTVYYHFWEQTNPPGRAIHASQRLIFMEKQKYLGQYVIADRPVLVRHNRLVFPYSREEGNVLQCGVEGLPAAILLAGSELPLER